MRITFLFLFLISSQACFAQSPFEWFNGETFWKKIMIDTPGTQPVFNESDTVIAVASTRIMQPDSFRSVGEARDKILHYFFVYSREGKWHVLENKSLRELCGYMPDPGNDWVIYTEGMGKMFTSDLDRGMQMAAQYKVNVLLLDYPSISAHLGSLRNYKFAIRNSRVAYKYFMPVLDSFKTLRQSGALGKGRLSFFFHSMGNNVIRQIAKRKVLAKYNDGIWVDNLVLNAPCVQRRRHRKWVNKIGFAERIYIHYNPHDATLKWARIVGFHQILGEHCKRPLSKKTIYINFNKLCGGGHSNFLWLYSRPKPLPEAKAHYSLLLHGKSAPINDPLLYLPTAYRNVGYDILPQKQ